MPTMIRRTTGLAALPLAGVCSVAMAGGFQITELCGRCAGSRIAGEGALAAGPATVWFNPAGMSKLDGLQLDLSLHYINGQFEFSDTGSEPAFPDQPLTGDPVSDGAEPALIPNFYVSWRVGERWAVGLGINAPYGTATDYDDGWVGRYHALRTELTTININPSFAYQVNDWFAVGAGLNAMHVEGELTNALDVGAIFRGLTGAPIPSSNPAFDGYTELTGDDWGWGWNVGALFSFNGDATRLGVSYRSQVSTTLDAELKTSTPGIAQFGISPLQLESSGTADLDLPATLVLGVSHRFEGGWTLLAGGIWTQWSAFDELTFEFDEGGQIVQPENWHDSWRWQLGAEYAINASWTVRAGYEYDPSPVDEEDNTARIPDADRQWLALGFSYDFRFGLSVDFGYSHIFIEDYGIDEQEVFTEQAGAQLAERLPFELPTDGLNGLGNTLVGDYDSAADIFSLGLRYRF